MFLRVLDNANRLHVQAIDLRTGRIDWISHDVLDGEASLQADDAVVVGSSWEPATSRVIALDASNGVRRWRWNSGPWYALVKGRVIVPRGEYEAGYAALDEVTGRIIWTAPTTASALGEPYLWEDIVFIQGDEPGAIGHSTVTAVRLSNGAVLWKHVYETAPIGVANGRAFMNVYFPGGRDVTVFYGVDLVAANVWTGEELPTFTLNPGGAGPLSEPSPSVDVRVTDADIYVALNDRFFKYRQQFAVERQRAVGVADVGAFLGGPRRGWFFFRDPSGLLMLRFQGSDVIIQRIRLAGSEAGALSLDGDTAYFGSTSGRVYSVNAATQAVTLRTAPVCKHPFQFITGREMLVAVCEGKLYGFPL